jgi:hypothetical protein
MTIYIKYPESQGVYCSLFDSAPHDPAAISPELMLKNLVGVDEKDRQLLYRITEWMKERRG